MNRPRPALLAAAGVVVVGAAGLLWWLGPSPSGKAAPEGPPQEDMPAQFRAARFEFDLDAARDGAESVAMAVAERVRAVADDTVPTADPQGLEDLVRERIHLLIEPDFDRWREAASRFGTLPMLGPDGSAGDELLARWRRAAAGFESAPIASAGITVRRIAPDEPVMINVPASMFMRPDGLVGGAAYPKPDPNDPAATVVEVLIPVKFRAVSGEQVPATAALRFFRPGAGGGWRPFDLILYFDARLSGGKTFQFPVF